MANQKAGDERSTTDQILDLLLDALTERQKARQAQPAARPVTPTPVPPPRPEPPPSEERRAEAQHTQDDEPPRPSSESKAPAQTAARKAPPAQPRREPQPGEEGWEPPPRQPSINMGKMLGRLAILVAVLIIAVNVPVTQYGVSLARILPETTSLIIRDGLVLKGSGPEIYRLEEGKLRWISSLDAFEHLRLTWGDVHIVEDEFLAKFEKGRPIHVLLKCRTSPHIYRLENDQKRWIKDIETFEAEGHVWEDVRFVGCEYLRDLPDGPPIPEDAGPPPQP